MQKNKSIAPRRRSMTFVVAIRDVNKSNQTLEGGGKRKKLTGVCTQTRSPVVLYYYRNITTGLICIWRTNNQRFFALLCRHTRLNSPANHREARRSLFRRDLFVESKLL